MQADVIRFASLRDLHEEEMNCYFNALPCVEG